MQGDNCTKVRWAKSWIKYKAATKRWPSLGAVFLSICASILKPLSILCLRCTGRSSSEVQSAALGDLQSPPCSAPPSEIPVLSQPRSNLLKYATKKQESCKKVETKNSGKAEASYWSLEFKFWSWRGPSWFQLGSKLYFHIGLARSIPDSWAAFFTTIWFFLLKKYFFRFTILMNIWTPVPVDPK